VVNSFGLLANPLRYRIVEIRASGEHMSGNISDVVVGNYGVSRAAVSKQLAILRENGWVEFREEGSARWYYLVEEVWQRIDSDVSWLKYLWDRRIGYFSGNDTDPRLASTWSPWGLHTES